MQISDYPSPNYNSRRDGITSPYILVVHTMSMPLPDALKLLSDPKSEFSSHYVIAEDGTVFRLVDEGLRAWHAGTGKSWWRGEDDINSRSIGIELIHTSNIYPEVQIKALAELGKDILNRFPIPARNVVGHSDIAPGRKVDPVAPFPWKTLATYGIGLWTDSLVPTTDNPKDLLQKIGYDTKDLSASLFSFQMHFLPENITGKEDELTLQRLNAVLRKISP